jgi:hypothetical protein
MTPDGRWSHLVALDEELLKGGVILSEWCSFIVREADTAFVHSAHLASILTAVSGIETYLRSEYAQTTKPRLVELIDFSPIPETLKENLHRLRKYRNKWVHIDEPWDDAMLIEHPQTTEAELKQMAFFAVRLLRETIYKNPWV